ncbi:MAG TPA: hypothetical protein VFY73_01395 [Ideonella sp.]|uniref:hypothetical protein n=1 Tax=Ideonella sp. TaxID=1929293 RepID=UPI002E324E16|nr:hypothetical protein [Ideonella sp.]HEX5682662.1 hypothetical protein [Ideonella sp.]
MSAMSPTDPLARLEGYLEQDPRNEGLLVETFELALRSGRQDRAEVHLATGLANGANPLGWRLRQSHWHMARRDWPAARDVLNGLLAAQDSPPPLVAAVRQDLALIALHTGSTQEGLDMVAPLLAASAGSAVEPDLQALYLRLLHRAGNIDAVLSAAGQWAQAGQLSAEAAGIASLAAFDAEQLDLCRIWGQGALRSVPNQLEASVACAGLALAGQDAAGAQALLDPVLKAHPQDGRVWSTWAFAQMLTGDLPHARLSLQRAVTYMPGHIGTWHGLGWTELLLGNLEGARAAFEQAMALDRNFAESHGGMAVAHARSGDRAAAELAIELALRLDRNSMSAHYARAVLDGRAEDADEVQQLARQLFAARRARRAN